MFAVRMKKILSYYARLSYKRIIAVW